MTIAQVGNPAAEFALGGRRSGDPHHPTFTLGPVSIELRSVSSELAEDFADLYQGLRPAYPAANRAIRMEVRAAGRTLLGARRYAVVGDEERMFRGLRSEELLPYLEWGINYRVIETRDEFLQLHAAALSYKGQGVILVGQSGSGKSTLTAALAARGWGYLSDEFALIDPHDCHLHPFPKALCVKHASFDIVRRLGLPLWCRRPYVKAFKGRVGYIRPRDLNTRYEAVPIRMIVFPSYTGGDRAALQPISRATAAFSLATNAFNRHVFGDQAVAIMGRIARDTSCVSLESNHLDHAVKLLEAELARQ